MKRFLYKGAIRSAVDKHSQNLTDCFLTFTVSCYLLYATPALSSSNAVEIGIICLAIEPHHRQSYNRRVIPYAHNGTTEN